MLFEAETSGPPDEFLLSFRVQGSGFRVSGLGCRVEGLEVEGLEV